MTTSSVRVRRGFTLIELLTAMALIVLVMSALSQAFLTGLTTFAQLKGIGDLNERLRTDAVALRDDVQTANRQAEQFIADTQRTGAADPVAAAGLKVRYAAIAADATSLEDRLRVVERDTVNPIARRLLQWVIGNLIGVKIGAASMVDLLDEIVRLGK